LPAIINRSAGIALRASATYTNFYCVRSAGDYSNSIFVGQSPTTATIVVAVVTTTTTTATNYSNGNTCYA
jgi:hypothetical protein